MFKLGVLDLLALAGFDRTASAKMVRHQHDKYPVRELLRRGWFELYQAYQARPVFDKVEYLVSFSGLTGTLARFEGVFRNRGFTHAAEGDTPPDCPWAREWKESCRRKKGGGRFYDLKRVPGFEDLEDRIIIDWGPGTLAWHQRLTNKPVVELTPKGRRLPPFDDYLEFSLSYAELRELFASPDAHREWRARLEAVGGIYLILAESTGEQYVGSASGNGGIWQRWQNYAQSGHGGNAKLRKLIAADPVSPNNFRFSILQITPKTISRDALLKREARFMAKLGSRAHGLNSGTGTRSP